MAVRQEVWQKYPDLMAGVPKDRSWGSLPPKVKVSKLNRVASNKLGLALMYSRTSGMTDEQLVLMLTRLLMDNKRPEGLPLKPVGGGLIPMSLVE